MMFPPESCVVVIVASAILHNISTRDCLHQKSALRPTTLTRGMARRVIVNRITATTAQFPMSKCSINNSMNS